MPEELKKSWEISERVSEENSDKYVKIFPGKLFEELSRNFWKKKPEELWKNITRGIREQEGLLEEFSKKLVSGKKNLSEFPEELLKGFPESKQDLEKNPNDGFKYKLLEAFLVELVNKFSRNVKSGIPEKILERSIEVISGRISGISMGWFYVERLDASLLM